MISTPENTVTFRTTETPQEINDQFDMIIYPMANIFSVRYGSDTSHLVKAFSEIRIPIYVIACGIQADSTVGIAGLIDRIGESSARLIEAVYKTGGEFALRGYYTKEFFDKLGYPSAVVTGCPSVYQMGRSFSVTNKKEKEIIRPVFNGNLRLFEPLLKIYPDSMYVAQDMYEDCLYREGLLKHPNLKKDILFTYNYSIYQAKLLSENRIRMLVDLPAWYKYLHFSGFNFALGTKLHGTIIAILAGIPGALLTVDYRTQEVAEFFHIPSFIQTKSFSEKKFLELYERTDYTMFNKEYSKKYDAFEQFLRKHRIVDHINENNLYFSNPVDDATYEISYLPNQEAFCKYYKKLVIESPVLWAGRQLVNMKNKKIVYKV